jgi:large subunit ribosomal protein L3
MTATFERAAKGLLGTKLGMTQLWDENNRVVPVTVIDARTNVVTQVRTPEIDGYNAVQVGFGEIEGRKVNKPQTGHFDKAGTTPRRHVVEIRTSEATVYTVGQELGADTFAAGEEIDVTGTSKGKGFAGVMKRHGFHGVGASHGAQNLTVHAVDAAKGLILVKGAIPGPKGSLVVLRSAAKSSAGSTGKEA